VAEEEEKEHFIIGGCDPIGDELGGVDEEWRYFKNVDHVVINQPENHEVEVQNRNRAMPIPEIRDFDTEVVQDDEATMLDDFIVPHTTHEENPTIKKGDTFVDKNEFVQTIRQYAIKKMSLRLGLNIVIKKGTWQGVQIKIVIGEYLQRNYMVATLSWWSKSQNWMNTLVPVQAR